VTPEWRWYPLSLAIACMLIYHKSLQEQCKYTPWWLLVVQNWARFTTSAKHVFHSWHIALPTWCKGWEPNYVQNHHVYIQFWQWCCWFGLESSVRILALLTQLSPTIFPASCSTCTYLPFKFVLGDILLEWISYTVTLEWRWYSLSLAIACMLIYHRPLQEQCKYTLTKYT